MGKRKEIHLQKRVRREVRLWCCYKEKREGRCSLKEKKLMMKTWKIGLIYFSIDLLSLFLVKYILLFLFSREKNMDLCLLMMMFNGRDEGLMLMMKRNKNMNNNECVLGL